MPDSIHAPIAFDATPPIIRFSHAYKVITAFTDASVGDILLKINCLTFFVNSDIAGSDVETPYSFWLNNTNGKLFQANNVNLANLELLYSNSSADTVNAINKLSSSLSNISTLNNNGNSYLSQISNTLGGAFATAQLNVEAIPIQTGSTNKTYNNVKAMRIYSQPLLLGTTLNLAGVTVNGVPYSLTTPVDVPIPANTKLSNPIVITNNNVAIPVIYTT